MKQLGQILRGFGILGILLTRLTLAENTVTIGLYDTDSANQAARADYVNRFIEFTQDKNVMGKAKDPSGKTIGGNQKTRFNGDDGLAYQSDLTYHDFSFNTNDEQAAKADPNDPNAKQRQLYSFISEHGGIAEGGGSSALERAIYEQHQKYSKQDEDPEQQKKTDQEEGVKYRSVFRVETRDVFKGAAGAGGTAGAAGATGAAGPGGAGGAAKPKEDEEPEKVERTFLRPDVREAAEKVGRDSFSTVERAAKSPDAQDDPKTMGNLTMYYEAASRLTKAMWDSTLANLTQRRVNRSIRGAGLRPTLSEGMPNCQAWGQAAIAQIQADQNLTEPEKQAQVQEIQDMLQQCQQMTQVKWSAVDPQFKEPEEGADGGGAPGAAKPQAQIEERGPEKEDDKARDLRNQLAGMDKIGIESSKLLTNWQYGADEDKAPITVGVDESGNPITENWTAAQQLEDRNNEIDNTVKAIQEVKKVLPDYDVDEATLLARKVQPGTTNILEINKVPEQMLEEFGVEGGNAPTAAQDYNELVQQSNAE